MLVKEIMTKNIRTITSDSNIKEAAEKMKTASVGALPVNELGESIWVAETMGMITDRDIVLRVIADDKDPATTKVSEIMTSAVYCCSENDSIEKAAEIMAEKKVHRLVVLNKKALVTGIVSLGDLAVKAEDAQLTSKVVKKASEYVKSENNH
jgi:CBS domain-containing protein